MADKDISSMRKDELIEELEKQLEVVCEVQNKNRQLYGKVEDLEKSLQLVEDTRDALLVTINNIQQAVSAIISTKYSKYVPDPKYDDPDLYMGPAPKVEVPEELALLEHLKNLCQSPSNTVQLLKNENRGRGGRLTF